MTDWKAFFRSIAKGNQKVHFFDPATEAELQSVKKALGISIPGTLTELLGQTNGISGEILRLPYVVGSCEEIIKINQRHEEWLRRDELTVSGKFLFFGENGQGDSFGYAIENGQIPSEEIGAYCPIEDEFRLVACDLKEWAIGLYANTLKY